MSPRQISNGPHFITTVPTVTQCASCGRVLLASTVGGIDYRLDTATLNDTGELMALLEGRATFSLLGERLVLRTAAHIAGARETPVLATHTCRQVPDAHIDHVWDEVAVLLAQHLLGATAVLPENPPY